MSVSIAISAAALAQSAQANAEAHAARVLACEKFVPGFAHDAATPVQRQEYAKCIGVLHPQALGPDDVFALKAVIVLVFLGIALGLWLARRDGEDSLAMYALAGVLGAIVAPLAVGAVCALAWGAWFVVAH